MLVCSATASPALKAEFERWVCKGLVRSHLLGAIAPWADPLSRALWVDHLTKGATMGYVKVVKTSSYYSRYQVRMAPCRVPICDLQPLLTSDFDDCRSSTGGDVRYAVHLAPRTQAVLELAGDRNLALCQPAA